MDDSKSLYLIDCAYSDTYVSHHLSYFQNKLNIPVAIQLVHKSGISRKIKGDKGYIYLFSGQMACDAALILAGATKSIRIILLNLTSSSQVENAET